MARDGHGWWISCMEHSGSADCAAKRNFSRTVPLNSDRSPFLRHVPRVALTHCLEVFGSNFFFRTKPFSVASMPIAFDSPILVVVVSLLEMALCVAFTAGHGTNRQHGPLL